MKNLIIKSTLLLLFVGMVNVVSAQTDHSVEKDVTQNQVMLKIDDGGEKYYNTAEVKSIDFEGYKITVRQDAGDDVYLNNVEDIVFFKADKSVLNADLIGTWTWEGRSMTITKDEISYVEDGEELFKVPYTYEDGVLTYTQPASEGAAEETFKKSVKFLYDKNVMVLKYDNNAEAFIKEGSNPVTPVENIRGTWLWRFGDTEENRAGIMIYGDTIEFIITAWSLRYVGKYTYSGGILTMNITEIYSGRSETGEGDGPGSIDPVTLESPQWYLLKEEDIKNFGYDNIPMSFPFIVDGTEAYSSFANLPAIYHKQKNNDDVTFADEPEYGGEGDPDLNPPD